MARESKKSTEVRLDLTMKKNHVITTTDYSRNVLRLARIWQWAATSTEEKAWGVQPKRRRDFQTTRPAANEPPECSCSQLHEDQETCSSKETANDLVESDIADLAHVGHTNSRPSVPDMSCQMGRRCPSQLSKRWVQRNLHEMRWFDLIIP
jgi:hypothetical protein